MILIWMDSRSDGVWMTAKGLGAMARTLPLP